MLAYAQESLEKLRLQEPDRSVRIELAPGLTARGDPGLLRIALENLLGKDPDAQLAASLSNETQVTKDTPPTVGDVLRAEAPVERQGGVHPLERGILGLGEAAHRARA